MATWLLVSILREAIIFANAALLSSIHCKKSFSGWALPTKLTILKGVFIPSLKRHHEWFRALGLANLSHRDLWPDRGLGEIPHVQAHGAVWGRCQKTNHLILNTMLKFAPRVHFRANTTINRSHQPSI